MRAAKKIYLIDQGVVFTLSDDTYDSGSLMDYFDEKPMFSIHEDLLTSILNNLDLNPEGYFLSSMKKDEFSLFNLNYRNHSPQILSMKAKIENHLLHCWIAYHNDDGIFSWIQEFTYLGKFEIWWKNDE